MEIVVRYSSEHTRSLRKFSVDVSHLDTTEPLVTLDQLSECVNFQHVSVKMKVLSITEGVKVINRELHKQECTIADATGSSKIVLWNENIDLFAEESIQGLVVGYQGSKYLSVGRDDINITPIDDIGEVQTPTSVCMYRCSTFKLLHFRSEIARRISLVPLMQWKGFVYV